MKKVKVRYIRGGKQTMMRDNYATILERTGMIERVIEPKVTKKKAKKKTKKSTYQRRDMKADD